MRHVLIAFFVLALPLSAIAKGGKAPTGIGSKAAHTHVNGHVTKRGTYVAPLGHKAIATARKLGKIEVDVGDTDCNIPDAESYIVKSRRGAPIAPKRKTVRC